MKRLCGIAAVVGVLCAKGFAAITLTLDKVDPSDGIPLPPNNLVAIDLSVDLSSADSWEDTQIDAFAENGARLVYAYAPSGEALATAPGPANRFVTFFSEPTARDVDDRFGASAAVGVAGRYCGGPQALLIPTEANIAVFGIPPTPPAGAGGYVARIVLDLSQVSDPAFRIDSANIVVARDAPQNAVVLLQSECPSQGAGTLVESSGGEEDRLNWGVYGLIPEPSTGIILMTLGALITRARR